MAQEHYVEQDNIELTKRITELEGKLQEIVDLDNNPDEPLAYSWGLEYFRRAHAIAKAALQSDDGRSAECA